MNSALLRRQVIEKRRSQSDAGKQSSEICAKFIEQWKALSLPTHSLKVGSYRALSGEFQTDTLHGFFEKNGASIYFPRVVDARAASLEFVSPRGEQDWVLGSYGIQEPKHGLKPEAAENLDLILVPGVAFGTHGERIGMGKGYYDRALSRDSTSLRISVAFDFQVFESIPQESWDQPVHWIFTEKRDLRLPVALKWIQQHKQGIR